MWYCGDCGEEKTSEAIKKLNQYFYAAVVVMKD